jgi:signal transduction histidine kinase
VLVRSRLVRRIARGARSVSLLLRVLVGSALFALLVAGTFALMLSAMSGLRRSTSEQAQAKAITAATLGLEQVVNQLEVSLQSYVFTGDRRFLASWRQGRAELPRATRGLDAQLANAPLRARQATVLETMITGYVTDYGSPLISIWHISAAAARAPVATEEGIIRIRSIRGEFAQLLAAEDNAASAGALSAKREADRAVDVGVVVLATTAALLVLFAIFLARGITGPVRVLAEGASRVAAGDLTTRLPESGAAEIHTLTRSFNAMASSLEQGKRELEAQNEELRQSQRLMAQVVSIVSHELRTPLSSIIGYTKVLLSREVGEADTRHYLEIVKQQGERLASLVEQFLASERIAAGQIALRDEAFDLRALLVDEATRIARDAPRHRVSVDAEAPLSVRGDRDRLAQVFDNLLDNAIKYSPEGGPVEVVAEAASGSARVRIRDAGIGVPEEHQARIFTRFYRAGARESGISGTGLGLAVSREIVEAHGGQIGFSSTAGTGSVFWFELPLAAGEEPDDTE